MSNFTEKNYFSLKTGCTYSKMLTLINYGKYEKKPLLLALSLYFNVFFSLLFSSQAFKFLYIKDELQLIS